MKNDGLVQCNGNFNDGTHQLIIISLLMDGNLAFDFVKADQYWGLKSSGGECKIKVKWPLIQIGSKYHNYFDNESYF